MSWESTYARDKHVWGDEPSALAVFARGYITRAASESKPMSILDLGCGYGRDTIYLAQNTRRSVLGVDNAREAIEMAQKAAVKDVEGCVEFRCCDFREMIGSKFEVVFASNFYQLLRMEERSALRNIIRENLNHGGMLFLSTLSISDPEHFGKGKRIKNEVNSFQDERLLHFCSREEIEKDFSFLTIQELFEHEYYEPRSNGETHHHISWIILGVNRNT